MILNIPDKEQIDKMNFGRIFLHVVESALGVKC